MKHGKAYSPVYGVWAQMLSRCLNERAQSYCRYGARGITVCERWRDFTLFYADMGDPPAGFMIERIDNNGNYEPGNCRWASRAEQSRNKRTNVRLTHRGVTRTLSEWADHVGISKQAMWARIRVHGWAVDRALATK